MGRHSAPDDASESVEPEQIESSPVAVATPARGRHARHDGDDQATAAEETAKIARIDGTADTASEAPPAEPPPPDTAREALPAADAAAVSAEPQRKPARQRSTAADVALVREHSDVRARVIAAVLVPFAVYTAAMAAIGKLDRSYLLWIWIPLITAGVLVGLFLDLGYRKYPR